MAEKPWYLSKTIWANVVAFIIAALTTVLQMTEVIDLGPHGPTIISGITSAIAVANIILRAITKSPIGV